MESIIELGATYKDPVTGFQGVASSSTLFAFACERTYLVSGHDEKGAEVGAAFDAVALERVLPPTDQVRAAIDRLHAAEERRVDARRQDEPVKIPPATGGARPTPSAIR